MARLKNISMNSVLILVCAVWLTNSWCYFKSFTTPDVVNDVNYSPDNSLIVVAANNFAYIYNAYSFQQINSYNAAHSCNSAKFSKDQKYIALGLNNNKVPILNATTYAFITNISSAFNPVFEVDFSWDYTKLMVCGKNNGIQIYSVPGFALLWSIYNLTDDVCNCRFAWNGEFAGGDISGNVHAFFPSYVKRFSVKPQNTKITGLDWSPDSQYFVVSDNAGKVYIYNPSTSNNPISTFTDSTSTLAVAYSKDFTFYATGTATKITNWYNGTVGSMTTKVLTYNQPTDNVLTVDFSYDSQSLAAGCKDKNVYIYYLKCNADCPVDQYATGATSCRLCALDLIGCRQCLNSTSCSSCTDNYYLNTGSNTCRACSQAITACDICSASNVCLFCIGTYYLNSPTQCSLCWLSISGCVSCSNSTVCLGCSANTYYLETNSTCTSCQVMYGCLNCNSSTICTRCKSGYFLDVAGLCEHCPFNCSLCSSNSSCTSCDTGYYLSTTTCLACFSNCVTCNITACFYCTVGFYLSGGSCLRCTPPCSTCSGASYCMSCLPYSYGPTAGVCSNCSNSCASCSSNTQCLSCNIGYYYLASNNSCNNCSQLVFKCQTCTNSTCLLCSTGYYQSIGTCLSCSSAMAGCLLCDNSSACILCQNDFYLNSVNCIQCSFPCLTCNDTSKCLSCALGYYLLASNSSCMPCSCPTCSSSTSCLSCALGLYLSGGSCLSCNSSISNCISCISSSICSTCTVGYYLNAGRTACLACSLGCTSCSSSSTSCIACDIGFYISTTTCTRCPSLCSTCSSSTVCTECVTGNYLSGNNCTSCTNIFAGCLHCNNSLCYSCQFRLGYYLNGSQCAKCNTTIPNCAVCSNFNTCIGCAATYAITSLSTCNSCSSFMPNCQFCSSNSTCNLCEIGFYANGGCSSCDFHCQTCSSGTVCLKCLANSLLLPNFTCVTCFSLIVGCDTCLATNLCTICGFGFYSNAGNCIPCVVPILGCLECSNSSHCIQCEAGFYLNTTGLCIECSSLFSGCLICNYTSNQCLSCQSGYFINSTSQCNLCSDSNCLTCNNSTACNLCKSGFYLTMGSCALCTNQFTGCIFCNSSQCYECQSGYYLNSSMQCSPCSIIGCQICNSTQSTQCISCNGQYYLSGGLCLPCANAISQCQLCSSSSSCFKCQVGFYVNTSVCRICSSIYTHCHNCLATACLECDSGFILNSTGCSLCASYIPGCSYCTNSTLCINCMVGYYLNSSGCSSCSNISGCLVCRNSFLCLSCDNSYYLQNGTCILCNNSLTACIACISNSICIACAGDHTLSNRGCQVISGQSYYPYPELKLTSEYINSATLKHTLWATTSQFNQSSVNLSVNTNISYITTGGTTANLIIQSYEWGPHSTSIIFYTNNPFDFQNSDAYNSISLFNKRLLSQSQSNLQLNAIFQLTMTSSAVSSVLPSANHTGALYLNYNINQPQFIASLGQIKSYNYWIFGLVITLYMILFYSAKAVVLPKEKNNGYLIAHVLYMKCPALAIYPAYAELINYCYGFMMADLPWLNYYFASELSLPTEIIPSPYRIFYVSMSLASTYLLPIALFALLGTVLLIIYKACDNSAAGIFCLVLYNFFLPGLIVAGMGCLQGAIYNSISQFTLNSTFYITGIIILFLILVESVYSLVLDQVHIYKLRILIKGICLSLLHFSPIYLFSVVVIFESLFLVLQLNLLEKSQPRLWLVTNILPNISLLLLVELSHSLLSLYLASILIVVALLLDLIMVIRQFKIVKLYEQLQIKSTVFNCTNQNILNQFNIQGNSVIMIEETVNPVKMIDTFIIQEESPAVNNSSHFYQRTESGQYSKLPSPNRSDNSLVFNPNPQ